MSKKQWPGKVAFLSHAEVATSGDSKKIVRHQDTVVALEQCGGKNLDESGLVMLASMALKW
jgi:hypothetical protein